MDGNLQLLKYSTQPSLTSYSFCPTVIKKKLYFPHTVGKAFKQGSGLLSGTLNLWLYSLFLLYHFILSFKIASEEHLVSGLRRYREPVNL